MAGGPRGAVDALRPTLGGIRRYIVMHERGMQD